MGARVGEREQVGRETESEWGKSVSGESGVGEESMNEEGRERERRAVCKAFESDLVSIESNDENLLIDGYLQTKHPHDNDKVAADYWIGGNDIESEGNFKWIGSEQPFTFTYWMSGQPDPAEQDCVEIRGVSNFRWHDETCTHQHRFICEKP
ncbi:perlucin-like [Saccostrea echinata]|uniref:perlucin-like n=1 Tax=Saccostrea echinata TaxID=191078 RepID=UPI002A82F434|nr:perlucin-like [Saccostrea echinata]